MAKVIKLKDGGILLYEKNKQSKATAFRVGILRGSYLDNNNGISHFFEHMIFQGTDKYTNDELAEIIRTDSNNLNASTSGSYMLIRSYESNRTINKTLKLCSQMLLDSNFDKEQIKNEKQIVLQEIIRSNDDVDRIADFNLLRVLLKYPEINSTILGDEKKLLKITQKDLFEYKNKNIVKQNFFASVSSSLPAFIVKRLLNKHFVNKMPNGEKSYYNVSELDVNGESALHIETKERENVVLRIAIPFVGLSDNKKLFYASRLVEHLSGLKGPVFKHFKETNQLAYALCVEKLPLKNNGVFVFKIKTSADKVNLCFDAVGTFLKKIKNDGVTEKDVARLKEKYRERKDRFVSHPVDDCTNNLFEYLDFKRFIKPNFYKRMHKNYTCEDINKIIEEYFNVEKVFVSVVGPVTKKDIYTLNNILKVVKG